MYDLIIIGTGPAGLTASIYASCFNLNHLLIGKDLGGQMSFSPDILNYPGFEEITGKELTEKMVSQVKKRGGDLTQDSVIKIEKTENGFKLTTNSGKEFETKTIILATGMERRKLNVPGETEYTGKGVLYCAICEKFDYTNQIVAVIGGANSAVQAALQLTHAASKVYIVYRGDKLRCDPILLEQVKNNSIVEIICNSNPIEILGDGEKVTGIELNSNNATREITLDKVFIEIGGVPGSALVISLGANVDPGGYIKVDEKLSTNIEGIFAAGDIVQHGLSIEQIATAVGLGARAAMSAFSFIKQQKAPTLWGTNQIHRPNQ